MNSQTIKIKILNNACLPLYSTDGSAGLDCFANIKEDIIIDPGERVAIPLGFITEMPEGWYADIRPRSGLALRNGITVLNTPGTIDSDFKKEWAVILINHSSQFFKVTPLMRICQILFQEYSRINFEQVSEINEETNSHGDGFGSTGI